jgi:hypothetical protein
MVQQRTLSHASPARTIAAIWLGILMKYSGTVVARDKVDYGFVVAGEEALFKFVVANIVDKGAFILASMTKQVGSSEVEQFADVHHGYARLMSCRRCHARHAPGVLDYVKSLPPGHRSDQLFSADPSRRSMSEADVNEGLLQAMQEADGYRAAVLLERTVPFLRADRRVVDIMDTVVVDAARDYAECEVEYLVRVAEAMQKNVVAKSSFLGAQVEMARACVAQSSAPTP